MNGVVLASGTWCMLLMWPFWGLATVHAQSTSVAARTTVSSKSPRTLAEFVELALKQGFDMEIEAQNLDVARDDLPIARSAFHPRLSLNVDRFTSRFPETGIGLGEEVNRSDGFATSINLSQRLPTGSELTLGAETGRSSSDPAFTTFNPVYNSGLTLRLRQPLLNGFGTRVNRLGIEVAKVGTDLAEHNYRHRALDIIEATENAYYVLASTREQLLVRNANLELSQAFLQEAEARRKAEMATHIDVLQAEVAVANARLTVVDAENAVRNSEDALRALIGRFELDIPLGATVLDPKPAEDLSSIEASFDRAREQSPSLRAARARLALARLEASSREDNLKPSVALELGLGVSGSDRQRQGAFSHAAAADGNTWQAGITVSYPIGRTAEKARWRQSRALVHREELFIQQLEQDILVTVRRAFREIAKNRESAEIAALAVELGRREFEAERERFRAGLSTGRRVLEAQTDRENANVVHLQARLNLLTAQAALQRIEGSALERYGVALPNPTTDYRLEN